LNAFFDNIDNKLRFCWVRINFCPTKHQVYTFYISVL
jgi:hypothetical protein